MTQWPGYRSCRKHGTAEGSYGYYLTDLNCPDCIVLPKAKSDGACVRGLRKFYGLVPDIQQVSEGEQLSFGEVA